MRKHILVVGQQTKDMAPQGKSEVASVDIVPHSDLNFKSHRKKVTKAAFFQEMLQRYDGFSPYKKDMFMYLFQADQKTVMLFTLASK